MLVIQFRFLSGRYHATPWDAHVNEGDVEWPPSPWRVLRALIATWYRKLQEELDEDTVRSLAMKLGSIEPSYTIPTDVVGAHTRHYMPWQGGNTTKVFDAFLHVGRAEKLEMMWAVTLTGEEQHACERLALSLNYLGRAESWVDARVVVGPSTPNMCVLGPEAGVPDSHQLVRLLAPSTAEDYERWRTKELGRRIRTRLRLEQEKAISKGDKPWTKLNPKMQRTIDGLLPSDPFEALHADTAALRKAGWNLPPGSRWLAYLRPRLSGSGGGRTVGRSNLKLTVARFAVTSNVPPHLTDALSVADRLHRTLVKWDQSPIFTGRVAGKKREDDHQHAFIFPEANGRDGRITHITVCARQGFDDDSRLALEKARRLWGRKGKGLQLVLLGLGRPEDFAGLDTVAGQCPLLVESHVWVSRTPFVSTTHPKCTRKGLKKLDEDGIWRGSPEHNLRHLIDEAGYGDKLVGVIPCDTVNLGGCETRWLEFHLNARSGRGGYRGPIGPKGFKLIFSEPVRGPLAFGYGAHFGLGVFAPWSEGGSSVR